VCVRTRFLKGSKGNMSKVSTKKDYNVDLQDSRSFVSNGIFPLFQPCLCSAWRCGTKARL